MIQFSLNQVDNGQTRQGLSAKVFMGHQGNKKQIKKRRSQLSKHFLYGNINTKSPLTLDPHKYEALCSKTDRIKYCAKFKIRTASNLFCF